MTDTANRPSPQACDECKQTECVCPKNRIVFGRWHFDWYNQWSAVFSPSTSNWIDYRFVFLGFGVEESPYKCSRELELSLLGFTLIITYSYWERETTDE